MCHGYRTIVWNVSALDAIPKLINGRYFVQNTINTNKQTDRCSNSTDFKKYLKYYMYYNSIYINYIISFNTHNNKYKNINQHNY